MSALSTDTVSVIIPAYNAERWIVRAVRSALEQIPAPLEVIVVDDGSTDDTATQAAGCGPSVTVISQPNSGTAAARNAAMDVASGEYIAFLDADDEWLPGTLGDQLDALRHDPKAGLVYGDLVLVDPGGHEIGRFLEGKEHASDGWVLLNLIRQCFVLPSAAMVRREICERHRIRFRTDITVCEDYEFWLELAAHCRFARVDRALARRTVHAGAKTTVHLEQLARDHVRLFGRLRDRIVKETRRSAELLSAVDRRLAHWERGLGVWMYRANDIRGARALFAGSFRRAPSLRTAALWAFTLTGSFGKRALARIRRST